MKIKLSVLFLFLGAFLLRGQKIDLGYYLPHIKYDPAITTPHDFLGFEVGEQHASHDQLYAYMKHISMQSERMKLVEYARSFENRPLICLIVTSKSNHSQLDKLKAMHVEWAEGKGNASSADQIPMVLYQGYSIHGNEASGSNASLAMAYYLAAGQGPEIENFLSKTIVLFDPSFNPDGMQRFSTWVNSNKSMTAVTDPRTREFNETWPGGRTNHYWFDLNRDWMPQQLPESKGRVKLFQEWKPNILTDHHEMGSNSSFFFMPGEPTRVNPNTPKLNQELTKDIAKFHAQSLDEIGSLYYSEEGYDDYYYGKGSTYPDVNGCVGILFEQASARGHAQNTVNGILTFPFAIRNHVRAALSTYKASLELRNKLLNYQRDYYKSFATDADKDPVKGYVLNANGDQAKMNAFIDILLANKIKVYSLKDNKNQFTKEDSYVVPCSQLQFHLIKGMFEKRTTFEDSLFYDISAWTYPLAFNLNYQELSSTDNINRLLGDEINEVPAISATHFSKASYAYALDWNGYYAPKALYAILSGGIRAKVMNEEFEIEVSSGIKKFNRGTVIIPVQNQTLSADQLYSSLQKTAIESKVNIFALSTGYSRKGIDLGSPSSNVIETPKVALLVGQGVDYNDAGEVWHLMDTRMAMPLGLADILHFSAFDIENYNTIVMVDGQYGGLSTSQVNKLKAWVQNGGTLIGMGRAINWLNAQGIAEVTIKPNPGSFESSKGDTPMRSYTNISADMGTDLIAGAIFETKFDHTHPLAFGLPGDTIPFFKPTKVFLEIPKNAYAAPFRYTSNPLMSGYISKVNLDQIKNSAAVVINGNGSGKVICIPDNPNFRAFWYGTNKVFLNAIFWGSSINNNAVQRVVSKE